MSKKLELSGQRFGRLIVKRETSRKKQERIFWECECDCGKSTIVEGSKLRSGHTKSCSCLKREATILRNYKHGLTNSRLHSIWASIKNRCKNPSHTSYRWYGKHNITVCNEWSNFINFYEWAMVNGYCDNLEIDRINTNKGYSPDNCRFVTHIKNMQNSRNSKRWSIDDIIFCSKSEAAKHFNVSMDTISYWCQGKKSHGILPKANCSVEILYPET